MLRGKFMSKPVLFVLLLLFAFVLFGCAGQTTIPANNTNVPTVKNGFEGIFKYQGGMPELANVTYLGKDGKTLVSENSYPGFVYLVADFLYSSSVVNDSIAANGGTVVSTIPNVGLYLVKVEEGSESSFLQAVGKESWFLDGMPYFKLEPETVKLYDFFNANPDPTDCRDSHGYFVDYVAGSRTDTADIDVGQASFDDITISINWDIMANMELAKASGKNWVFGLSMGPGMPQGIFSEDRTGCMEDFCVDFRSKKMLMIRQYMHTIQFMIENNPEAAAHGMVVISAGNMGVEMDAQMAELRREYPDAFKMVKVVGATDTLGTIEYRLNHLENNSIHNEGTPYNMVYARGVDVDVGPIRCSGTSFASPEVSSVLDYIWSQAPSLNASQVMDSFDQAMREMSSQGVIPQDEDGKTSQEFLNRAAIIAQTKLPSEVPYVQINGTDQYPSWSMPLSLSYFGSPVSAKVGQAYFMGSPPTAMGGVEPYKFSATGLPSGLSISSDGSIIGTPSQDSIGEYNVVICVTDAAGEKECVTLELEVKSGSEVWIGEFDSVRYVCNVYNEYSGTYDAYDGQLNGHFTATIYAPSSIYLALKGIEGGYGEYATGQMGSMWSGSESVASQCSDFSWNPTAGTVSNIPIVVGFTSGIEAADSMYISVREWTDEGDYIPSDETGYLLLPGGYALKGRTVSEGGMYDRFYLHAVSISENEITGTFALNPGQGTFTLRRQS